MNNRFTSLLLAASLVLPALLATIPVRAQEPAAVTTHPIGQIPPVRVWYSDQARVQFAVAADALGAGAAFAADFDPEDGIAGTRTFDEAARTFTYVPAPGDAAPFEVTFIAIAGDGVATQAQTVEITPLRPLPPETSVLGLLPKGPLPDGESTDYLDVAVSVIPGTSWFNAQNRPSLRSVTVVGKTVVLEPDHANGLWGFNNAADIRDFTVHAETLVIRGAFVLPQSNITIRATEVLFEDRAGRPAASITTTPLSSDLQPVQFANGRAGHNAGSLTVFADAVTGAGSIERFILTGGNGERAGQGKRGSNGANRSVVHEIKNGIYGWKWSDNNTIYAHFDGLIDTTVGSKTWPGDGTDATAGGKPGIAGDGGAVTSNLDLRTWTSNGGGRQGTVADYQSGGTGGTPRQAWRRYYNKDKLKSYDERFSSNGAGASGPNSTRINGSTGAFTTLAGDLRWLSPLALDKVLAHVREAYLAQHFDFVRETLADYVELLELATQSSAWANLEAREQGRLLQILDEMRTLRHRVDSHLDFFGNPAGWVPMLSFEVNKLAFENEIPRALRVMYLEYWLRNRANTAQRKVDAMQQLRSHLREQIVADREAYSVAVAAVPGLQFQARSVQDGIDRVKTDIETIKNSLLGKAKNIALLKKTARALGAIAEVVPVGQPYVGVAGKVLGRLPDVDPDKPVEENALIIGTDIAREMADSPMDAATLALKARLGALDSEDIDNASAAQTEQIRALQQPIMDLLGESLNQMRMTQNPSPEVEAELQRLLADEPGFRVLSQRLTDLNRQKVEFATKLAQTLQDLSRLSLAITRNLLTIDVLNRNIVDTSLVLDAETLGALDAMNQRARERLLKYHYFMARAYEYRMLQPYDGALDLTKVTDRFKTLGTATGPELTAAEFDSLRSVYEDQVSAVVFTILSNYNSNRPSLSAPVRVTVPQTLVDRINAGETAALNLRQLGLFLPSQENVRIVNLRVVDLQVEYTGSRDDVFYADVIFQHAGESRLQMGGDTFLFRHYNEETRSKIEWSTRFDPYGAGTLDPVVPAAADQSLLKALLSTGSSSPSTEDLLLYSRPAADADLLVTSEVLGRNGAGLRITSMRIELVYDFSRKDDSIKTLDLAAAPGSVSPLVRIGRADRNDRRDGEGSFQRSYDVGSSVTLEAPAAVGRYQFVRWEADGVALADTPEATIAMTRDLRVVPVYQLRELRSIAVAGGIGSGTYLDGEVVAIEAIVPDGRQFVRWEGATVADPTAPSTTFVVAEDASVQAVFASIGGFSSLVNISSRAQVGGEAGVLIPGFYIEGSAPKKVLIRAAGPTLGQVFGVPGALEDPSLKVMNSAGQEIAGNDDWGTAPNLAELRAAMDAAYAFSFLEGSRDAALLVTLQPGGHTVHVSGPAGTAGVALVEVYDADSDQASSQLVNISTRAFVGRGAEILIPGFIVEGDAPKRFLIRAVGPTLGEVFGVPGALADPVVKVYRGSEERSSNDNWEDAPNAATIASTAAAIHAFPLLAGSRDAAVLIELEPGSYTIHAAGVGDTTGVALVEVYALQ